MGSAHSARSTDFQSKEVEDSDDFEDEHHISISNKMVERLVDDVTLAEGAAAVSGTVPRSDYRDNILMEKLKCIDEKHSEKCGLRIEDIQATAARIELRTANMVNPVPVCEDCKEQVIDCYLSADSPYDNIKCWETVGAFSACVQAAGARALRAHTQREARVQARRERHAASARQHALKDLTPPHATTT